MTGHPTTLDAADCGCHTVEGIGVLMCRTHVEAERASWAVTLKAIRDAAQRVRDELGAPSDAADIAYAVSCGDADVAVQAAKRLAERS